MAPIDSLMDAGEHFRRRLGLFLLVIVIFIGVSFVFVEIMSAVMYPERFWEITLEPGRVIHLAATLIMATLWAVCRWGGLSAKTLGHLDAGATTAFAILFSIDIATNRPELRPETLLMVLLTDMLIVRAALVPSTARRTLALGAVATLAAMAATAVIYAGADGAVMGQVPSVVRTAFFMGMAVAGTTLASRVIYGLRERASRAVRLGQYVLESKLGEGGMGVVYRASHAMLKRPTAVKLISPDRAGPTALARFEREVQLTASLAHPNTIAIYDYGRTAEGVFYYAMEYLDGLTLEALVELDGPQPPARVVHILQKICGALAEAHGVGLIHRDIKPANVILCERGGESDVVKVLDFGLVRRVEGDVALSTDGAVLGTPLYTAPEALTAPDKVDGRADLYAVGAVGYYLLAGEHVFGGKTVVEVMAHHLHTAPQPIGGDVPPALDAVILRCLEKDRARRPATAAELAAALGAATWTQSDAAAWWRAKGAAARGPGLEPAVVTMTVDLERRGA